MNFAKKNRVPRELFETVFKKTKPFSSQFLKLRFSPANEGVKASFVVAKNVAKKATTRNLIKRRGYSILRSIKNEIKGGVYLFFIQPKSAGVGFSDFKKEIIDLIKKARLFHG